MLLRPARPDDAPALARCFQRAVHTLGRPHYDVEQLRAWAPDDLDAGEWRARVSSGFVLVAEAPAAVAGFVRVDPPGWIDLLFVDPDCARTGVGHALLTAACRWSVEQGAAELGADVSLAARRLFESAGFETVREQSVVRRGVELRNLRMQRAAREPRALRLRPATPGDVPLLRRWDEAPHVIASDPNDDWQWESELGVPRDWRDQFIAEVDGRPVGYIEIIDPAREPERYWGDVPAGLRAIDVWIGEAADLGHGFGTRMMQLALERCFAAPDVQAVLVDPLASNERAQRFYQRLGFRFVERRRFGADDCAVHRLGREAWRPA